MPLKTPSSLAKHLRTQIGYLERSCEIFDSGTDDEAQRLATTIRVLFHDTEKSKSLLTQLGMRSTIMMVDTGLYRDRLDTAKKDWFKRTCPKEYARGLPIVAQQPGEAGLVCLQQRGLEFFWVAPLGFPRFPPDHPNSAAIISPQPFDKWWSTPLIETSQMTHFSRKELILDMANGEGGAHVDPKLNKKYEALTVDFLGVQMEAGENLPDKTMGGDIPPVQGNVAAASVRQIAFEVLETVRSYA